MSKVLRSNMLLLLMMLMMITMMMIIIIIIIKTSIGPSAVDIRALFHHSINAKAEQLNRYTL